MNFLKNIKTVFYQHTVFKQQSDAIYKEEAKGIKTSKCNWYELGEKSTKFYLNLENIVQSKVKYILLL